MKKFFISLLSLGLFTMASAQDILSTNEATTGSQMEFHFGLKGGLNFTTYSSDADDVQAHLGQWGAVCRWQWKNFSIQPELFYSSQGVRSLERMLYTANMQYPYLAQDNNDHLRFKMKLYTQHVVLPVMFKWYLPVQLHGLNIQAGPQLAYRFDYSIHSNSPHGYIQDSQLGSVTRLRRFARDMNLWTMSANFGVGYDSPSGIGVEFRCCMGITPVFKGDIEYTDTDGNVQKYAYNSHSKDRVWAICFTYVL